MTAHRGRTMTNAEFRRLWLDESIAVGQIGALLGISQQAVSSRADRRGLPPRRMGPPPTITDDALFCAMWAAGVANLEMAQHFGIHERTVRNHVKRLGLARRTGGNNHGITSRQFIQDRALAQMRADAAEVKAQWRLAEMVDGSATSGRWAA